MAVKNNLVIDFFALQQKAPESILQKLQKIRSKPPKNLDTLMQQLHNHYFQEIDCLDCANCCKTLSPGVNDADIVRLARFLKQRPSQVVESFFDMDADGDYVFRQSPCPFLCADNYCSVYEARPRACREYPHTDRRRFYQLTTITKHNVQVCPAVHYILQDLQW